MQIERVHRYIDSRFPSEVLWEHGAFLIDNYRPCMFKIRDYHSATVFFDDYTNISEIIDEFRFYAEHITVFYDNKDRIIAEYPPVTLKTIPLEEIQPARPKTVRKPLRELEMAEKGFFASLFFV